MKTSQLQKAMVVNLPMDLKFTKKENSLSIITIFRLTQNKEKSEKSLQNYQNFININSDSEIHCLIILQD